MILLQNDLDLLDLRLLQLQCRNDALQRLIPAQRSYLLLDLLQQRIDDGAGILERLGRVGEVLDGVGLERVRVRALLQNVSTLAWPGRVGRRTEDLPVGGVGAHAVHDGEGELALGQVFCEALVVRVLRSA